jgi:2-C-methyl-D-erythritol 2,4-cyclodiphosphate synthase
LEGKRVKVGLGWDQHPFKEGRSLVLGGVQIPYERGLFGHSDADVVVHALCDALLGGANLPDLGTLFSSEDDRFRGISSLVLLEEVLKKVREKGFTLGNVDIVIIAQSPKLSPFIERMREILSEKLGISREYISIKAKSPEGMGAIGRGEGITALAVALLYEV